MYSGVFGLILAILLASMGMMMGNGQWPNIPCLLLTLGVGTGLTILSYPKFLKCPFEKAGKQLFSPFFGLSTFVSRSVPTVEVFEGRDVVPNSLGRRLFFLFFVL